MKRKFEYLTKETTDPWNTLPTLGEQPRFRVVSRRREYVDHCFSGGISLGCNWSTRLGGFTMEPYAMPITTGVTRKRERLWPPAFSLPPFSF